MYNQNMVLILEEGKKPHSETLTEERLWRAIYMAKEEWN